MNAEHDWEDALMRQLDPRTRPWLSCDDCFESADRALEGLLERGEPLPAEFQSHLRGCPACRDEAQTLAEMIAAQAGGDPAAALDSLNGALE